MSDGCPLRAFVCVVIREQATEIYPDSADAMKQLELAYARLFREHATDLQGTPSKGDPEEAARAGV